MSETYTQHTPRAARLVERLQILPEGQHSDAQPLALMISGLPILLAIEGVKRYVDDGRLMRGSEQLHSRLKGIEDSIETHCRNVQGDNRVYTIIEAYDGMLDKIRVID